MLELTPSQSEQLVLNEGNTMTTPLEHPQRLVRRVTRGLHGWLIVVLAALPLTASPVSTRATTSVKPQLHGAAAPTDLPQIGPFVVNNAGDSGDSMCGQDECTLREAISAANTKPLSDTITFNLAALEPISVTSALPTITDQVFLDGTTQAGASCSAPKIELTGGLAGGGANGLNITAGNSTVKGLIINRFAANGIRLAGGGGNTLQCSWIGLDAAGGAAGNGLAGIRIESPSNQIGGTAGAATRNVIAGNAGNGVEIANAAATLTSIQGNYIGTNPAGSARVANGSNGIRSSADQTLVGGPTAGAGNLISGNTASGIHINVPAAAVGSAVQGNLIGVALNGTASISNTRGIFIESTPKTLVGGPAASARNIISGNRIQGIIVQGSGAASTTIANNYIGVGSDGLARLGNNDGIYINNQPGTTIISNTISANKDNGIYLGGANAVGTSVQANYIGTNAINTPLGNYSNGVVIDGAVNTLVGGTSLAQSNVIGDNGNYGILIFTSTAAGTQIKGNFIGAARDGLTSIPNFYNGIRAVAGSGVIGGTAAGEGNLIAFNKHNGILLTRTVTTTPSGYTIAGNRIYANIRLGIDLDPAVLGEGDGVTANDALDVDSGPNTLQNYPVLTAASSDLSQTRIDGSLNSTPNTLFKLDFYSQGDCDPSGSGEGGSYVGQSSVTTNGSGTVAFTQLTFNVSVPAGQKLTATATAPDGSTSEFSQCVTIGTLPALSINNVSLIEGNSGTKQANFTLSLTSAVASNVVIQYTTSDNTASTPIDYLAATGIVTIPAGQLSAQVVITTTGDLMYEQDETFLVNVLSATNASINDGEGQGTIVNDDSVPTISIADTSVVEGNTGNRTMIFTATLSNPNNQAVTVNFATANGTASTPSDYLSTSGSLTFESGDTSATLSVSVVGDTIDEPNETVLVNLSGGSVAISDAQAQGTIVDDDLTPTLSVNDVSVTETNTGINTNAVFTVSLSGQSQSSITLNYATANGSATAPADYLSASGPLTFAPGQTTRAVTVTVVGDNLDEATETFVLNLSAGSVAISDAQGQATINDNDGPPSLSIADSSVLESPSSNRTMIFTVTLSALSGQPVTVSYATANGSATAPADYLSGTGSVTIPAGSLSGTISVTVKGDNLTEGNETFSVGLSNPINVTINDGSATGTIIDAGAKLLYYSPSIFKN
jgi:CSLREA domain-containing protein